MCLDTANKDRCWGVLGPRQSWWLDEKSASGCPLSVFTEGYPARRTVRLRPRDYTECDDLSIWQRGRKQCSRPLALAAKLHLGRSLRRARAKGTYVNRSTGHRMTYRVFNDLGRQKHQQLQRTDRCLGRLRPRQTKRARHNTHRTAPCSGSTIFSESA